MPDKLKVVFCWHMHQPNYYDAVKGEYQLPWTYLHAIKDYVDMAVHLEHHPQAKAVVNFAPTLLEQLDNYAIQVRHYLSKSNRKNLKITDPLLNALATEELPREPEARIELIENCLRANQERIINRFEPYLRLTRMAEWLKEKPELITYLDQQYLIDILVWYHLGWIGETIRRTDERIIALMDKEHQYDQADRVQLLEVISEILTSIIPRYKALADREQVELSFTPYAHPIIPLLLEVNSAREAVPDIPLPNFDTYPDGKKRVTWHIKQGIKVFKKYFDREPVGCWPSEGSVSEATLHALQADSNVRWVATGENVLRNSLIKAGHEGHPHHPYKLVNNDIVCFFRDDGLSDNIGFQYSNWHSDDAVNNLVHHLENIAHAALETGATVVPIILDGENAWESYHENGYYFLDRLYEKLSDNVYVEMATFADCLEVKTQQLPHLVAGSWVFGTFSTWIGDKDKNRAWEMLHEAKQMFDQHIGELKGKQKTLAERQLAVCEGSDWCWWFGDYNPSTSVGTFDSLYRQHLSNLYLYLGQTPPEYLKESFSYGGGDPAAAGTMRPGQEN
ncbi:glycoside hydrolase family 57 protein [Candidatus Albibeggiatoa sp. nov. BB20]|uniref:glycoside hydrolase family 57 protein n=1 Tax=Candidatus Albibeggiatoa sp. nov. BB20 TaxID=3162723 RepID=UPI00336575D1